MKRSGKTFLISSFAITIVVSALSRFFIVNEEMGWNITVIAATSSTLFSLLIANIYIRKNKRKLIVKRYILLTALSISLFIYIDYWNKLVCVRPVKTKVHDITLFSTKNIITGANLIDTTFETLNKLNQSDLKCTICDSVNQDDPYQIWTTSSILVSKKKLTISYIVLIVLLAAILTHLVEESILIRYYNKAEGVFISYNHNDKETAEKLKQALNLNNIKTIIDSTNMLAGDNIESFIRNSILKTRVTLMIVSRESLLSGWVATEAITTFFLEMTGTRKAFIACYLDEKFLDAKFSNEAATIINEKLKAIHELITERDKAGMNSRDLNDQKNRLYLLKDNLDKIIQRLQNSLVIDIQGKKLEENLSKIKDSISKILKSDPVS